MDYFKFDDNKLSLNKEAILLIKDFAALWEVGRNKIEGDSQGLHRKRAFREFTYMYLMYDWESPYKNFSDRERHETALDDAGLTPKQFGDELFKAACKKYIDIQDTRMVKLLKGMNKTIDELTLFLSTVDLQERDVDGKPIFNAKQINDMLNSVGKTVTTLEQVEAIVRKQKEGGKERIRGDNTPGLFD